MDELFGFRHSMILLVDTDQRGLTVAAERGYDGKAAGARVPWGTGVIGVAARQRRVVRVGSLSRHRAYAHSVRKEVERSPHRGELDDIPALPGLPDVETQIAIPLLIGSALVGVFAVESAQEKVFTEKDEQLAGLVGNLAAAAIHNALLHRELARANDGLRTENATLRAVQGAGPGRPLGFEDIVGDSKAMKALRRLLRKVAATPSSTVLITGENGTGKDLAAKVIHGQSRRAAGPFMNITCSALPEALLESELFGHEKGAFTDAREQKKGLLELADGGTVFLDEIGEMSLVLQAKLLRFLEEKAFRRVGGSRDLKVDVRVLAATNRDLRKEVREGRFREDLYYRLRVLPVEIPPLRDRAGDVPLLVQMFARQFSAEFRKEVTVSPEALAKLEGHAWPGNVRELRNAVERAVLLSEGGPLGPDDFDMLGAEGGDASAVRLPPGGLDFLKLERDLVLLALERCGYNKSRAARLLRMDRDWLRYRMEKHGIHAAGKPGRPAE
jgi:transcriptional regulator with GAF, ATPase, and Fis domain